MSKTYNGFVKITNRKAWKKKFSKEELEQIEAIFNNHFSKFENSFNGEDSYLDNLKRDNFIVHAETDIWDDTLGVSPKSIKKFIDKNGIELLSIALSKLQKQFSDPGNNNYGEYSEDHGCTFYNFDKAFKEANLSADSLNKFIQEEEERLAKEREREMQNKMYDSLIEVSFGIYFYKKLSHKDKISLFEHFQKFEKLDLDILIGKQKEAWSKVHGFVPEFIEMFSINPEEWDKKIFLDSMYRLYKTRQMSKLSEEDRIAFVKKYLALGKDISIVPFHLLNNENITSSLYATANVEVFSKIVRKISQGIVPDMSINDLISFKYLLMKSENLRKSFEIQKEFRWKDINNSLEISEFISKIPEENSEVIDYIFTQNKSLLKNIFLTKNASKIFELFMKNKDNECSIPNIKFNYNEYEVEIIKKDDIRGYVSGYPYSCQYIGGLGERFAKYGYENKDSSFLIISKNGETIAGSWLWTKNNQLTFDSIDRKGGVDLSIIEPIYTHVAKEILDSMQHIDIITVGSNAVFKEALNNYEQLTNTSAGYCYDSKNQYLVAER